MPDRNPLVWVQLWDGRRELGRWANGLPTFDFGHAPTGLATRRQLRARSMRPGGHGPYAQLVWAGGRQWAGLYRLDLARLKRIPTLAQRRALAAAMTARRTCRDCRQDAGYCLPTSTGTCWGCDPDSGGLAA